MTSVVPTRFENEIHEAIPKLLELAREMTWNEISDNCKFILSEITNSELNAIKQIKLRNKVNDRKIPVSLTEVIIALKAIYDNLYDVNLFIYKSNYQQTIIDVRYYAKSSLDKAYREQVTTSPPMLHCKVALPPWLSDKKTEKFDINWEHKMLAYRWKMFWSKLGFR